MSAGSVERNSPLSLNSTRVFEPSTLETSTNFHRVDHFYQHVCHTHSGTRGKRMKVLANACREEIRPESEVDVVEVATNTTGNDRKGR